MFTLKIKTDNEAFGDDPSSEVARILLAVAVRVMAGDLKYGCGVNPEGKVRDVNGNTVGSFRLTGGAK